MTSTTTQNGRLGNQIIRNLAVNFCAKKHDLHVNYANKELIEKMGINLFCGKNIYDNMIVINDDNYFSILNRDKLESNLNPNNAYFQTKEISIFLYNYLHTYETKVNIIDKNPFNLRYNSNNDLFIHIRLTDTAHNNPGLTYYLKTIKSINFDNLYIATDDPTHFIIREIIKQYPNTNLFIRDEITTMQFGSTCKNIILSHGSFSAIIGYIAFFSTIYYPEYEIGKIWYGDMFSINTWKKCNIR